MKHNKFLVLLLSILVLLALACSISASPTAPQPTSDIQGTINAAVAITETAQATTNAGLPPTDTAAPPTATEVLATPTAEQEAPPTSTPSQAPTAPASLLFANWGMQFFVPLSSGCKVKDAPCWKTDDDFSKHTGSQMILTSKDSFFIEPSWPSPYLVFWHKRDLKTPASLQISIDGNWLIVRDFTKSSGDWTHGFIELRDYKGKEIGVRFMADGVWTKGFTPRSLWYIQEVQIIPDFTPP